MTTPLDTPPVSEEESRQLQNTKSAFDALKTAMSDKASLLENLPFNMVRLVPHDDDALISRNTLVPWKIEMGTTTTKLGEDPQPIFAYLIGGSKSDTQNRNFATSFFSSSPDGQEATFWCPTNLFGDDLRQEFSGASSAGALRALVKTYFMQSGVCDDYPVSFSKSYLNDIVGVCSAFEKRKVNTTSRASTRVPNLHGDVPAQHGTHAGYFMPQEPVRRATSTAPIAPMMHSAGSVAPTIRTSSQTISKSVYQSPVSVYRSCSEFNPLTSL